MPTIAHRPEPLAAGAGLGRWARAHRDLVLPGAAALLALVALRDAGTRPLLVLGVPLALVAIGYARWPRPARAAGGAWLGVLLAGAGVLAAAPAAIAAGAALLLAGASHVRRDRAPGRRRRRVLKALATPLALFALAPLLLAANYLAAPREPIDDAALGLPHERVAFPASDGVPLAGWWVPGRGDAAVVVIHGGGGDREGAVAHARMLARDGFGVLLYDARGRGESGGHSNAFGWEWDRDVRGAVDFLERRGVRHISLLGLSTGAEAAITEAAGDPRVEAVVADGVQLRQVAETEALAPADRAAAVPYVGLAGAAIRLVQGERPPAPLDGLVARLAADRRLLMIATVPIERTLQRAYARGTRATVWELPGVAHTAGLRVRPDEYARRVTAALAVS